MSELSLIPFGMKQPGLLLVDVSEVDRGRKCNCICPSCKTPLIAKQGSIKEWHFAHASKGVSSDTEKECEYSFWVSVTLMAKQVLKTADNIILPPLTMYSNDATEFKVSEQSSVKINEIKIDKKINAISVDATLKLGDYTIALIFTAPHKKNNRTRDIIKGNKIGILEIALDKSVQWLYGSNNKGKYTKALKENILNSNNCKSWYFHPRQTVIERRYNVILNKTCSVTTASCDYEIRPIENKHYKCFICKNNWFGTNVCNNCKTQLYSIEIKNT